MGSAEVIALSEVRASRQWQRLRDQLHTPSAMNVVSQNEVFTNEYGVFVQGLSNMVSGNNVSGNNAIGIRVAGDGPNTIIKNIVLGNGALDIDRDSGEQVGVVIENNVCAVSEPPGLCPALIPDFDIDH